MRQKREQRRGGATAAPGRRVERVTEQVQRILSSLLVERVSDPRLEGVLVTRVQMTPDLRLARARVHALAADGADRDAILAGLVAATPFFRRELAASLDLRFTPELRFFWDDQLDEARRIDSLLRGARPRPAAPGPEGAAEHARETDEEEDEAGDGEGRDG